MRAAAPRNVNTTWVTAPTVTSATIAAVASAPGTPPAVNSRARAKSPPTCAAGSNAFTASPIQRRRSVVGQLGGRGQINARQPAPLSASGTIRYADAASSGQPPPASAATTSAGRA